LLQRKARLRAPDYLIVFFGVWTAFCLVIHHGLFSTYLVDSSRGDIESVGYEAVAVALLETAGAYLLARVVITGPAQCVAIMCAFTVAEARTGVNAFGIYEGAGINELRFGLYRAAGTFPHSILWGLFAATPFAYFAARALWKRRPGAGALALASLIGVATSVSSTAVLAVAVQGASLGWAKVMRVKRRWTLLALGGFAAYAAIEAISSRPAINVVISRLSFSAETGYMRLIQWDYGWREVMASPIVGIGMRAWERPDWLSASIDSFWLALSIRFGLVAPAALLLAMILLLAHAARAYKRNAGSPDVRLLIRVWSITVVSLAIAGLAVHFWAQSLVVFFFLLGCHGGLTKTAARAPARS
ncbi:MAG: hypothetical protein GWO02_06620, partial [Gammaproteobacteria bacterium]|nr:hypothetical protein [Gammaproteobacteria bacterium]